VNSSLCSHCGERILPHWTLCPVCALPFADAVTARPVALDSSDEFHDHSGLHCVQCKSSITPDAQICPQCHVLIVRRYCSGCSRLIPDQAALCPYCTTPATAKRSRMKFYVKTASALMAFGSIVVGLYFFLYKTPSVPAKRETPMVIAPLSSPGLIPQRPKTESPQFAREPMKTEPQSTVEIDPRSLEANLSGAIQSGPESDPVAENADIPTLQPKPAEEVQTPPQEANPAEGEWENRGARLKQGRKLTIRASQLMQQGRYTEASIVLKDAIHMFPQKTKDLSYGEALYKLGICLRRKGQPEQAIPVLREAMQFPYYRSKVLREVEAATGQIQRTKLNQTRG
jgi:RNA polymerase subunit RPABC4/transcription elongation factor Spt4/TolA-binding protein